MFYTYKVTFVDAHYYYGQRNNDPDNDIYFGSPVTNKEHWYQVMYGKEVISVFDNPIECALHEAFLIGDKWKTDPLCLNASPGGSVIYDRHKIFPKLQKCNDARLRERSFPIDKRFSPSVNHKLGQSIAKVGRPSNAKGHKQSQSSIDNRFKNRKMPTNEIIGMKFGSLTVIKFVGTKRNGRHFLTECNCGKQHVYSLAFLNAHAPQICKHNHTTNKNVKSFYKPLLSDSIKANIIKLSKEGYSQRQIAKHLGVSKSTVQRLSKKFHKYV